MPRTFKPWTPSAVELELLHECWLARLPPARIAARLGISELRLRRFEARLISARQSMPPPARPGHARKAACDRRPGLSALSPSGKLAGFLCRVPPHHLRKAFPQQCRNGHRQAVPRSPSTIGRTRVGPRSWLRPHFRASANPSVDERLWRYRNGRGRCPSINNSGQDFTKLWARFHIAGSGGRIFVRMPSFSQSALCQARFSWPRSSASRSSSGSILTLLRGR